MKDGHPFRGTSRLRSQLRFGLRGGLLLAGLSTAALGQFGTPPTGTRPTGAPRSGEPLRQPAPPVDRSNATGILISLNIPSTRAVALFFVASDCPVSNRTFPEMKRIREKFAPLGVKVLFVYPNAGERKEEVEAHQRGFDPGGEVVFNSAGRTVGSLAGGPAGDAAGDLAQMFQAKVTPEVSVLVPEGIHWRTVYTGPIDDRFVHIGVERPHPTRFFAEEALNAALAGKTVPKETGVPVGCAIVRAAISGKPEEGRR